MSNNKAKQSVFGLLLYAGRWTIIFVNYIHMQLELWMTMNKLKCKKKNLIFNHEHWTGCLSGKINNLSISIHRNLVATAAKCCVKRVGRRICDCATAFSLTNTYRTVDYMRGNWRYGLHNRLFLLLHWFSYHDIFRF